MIVILGSDGLLGRQLQKVFQERGVRIRSVGRSVNICQKSHLEEFLASIMPKWIINCAAFTQVDAAEEAKCDAYAANVLGPTLIAQLATKLKANLIHFSTDYVFSGNLFRPLIENDEVKPINVYGSSKWAGEEAVRRFCPHHLILRTAWLYGSGSPGFVNTILTQTSCFHKERRLGIVYDQYGSPTSASFLAQAVANMIASNIEAWGTYHVACSGGCSRYLLAKKIVQEAYHLGLVKCPTSCLFSLPCHDYLVKACRPKYTILSSQKLAKTFGIRLPSWKKALKTYLKQLRKMANKTGPYPWMVKMLTIYFY